jgi:hypothetical protein
VLVLLRELPEEYRVPLTYLDQFVLDLRRELAKSGELKNQRIVSLDVTEQYTDIESRLRASRAIEERLIDIIKTGKGEIKNLIAAEKELRVWRTKIEEMEGEIRYYGNQVALSTLTITLNEREILAPTAIVVTENVRMRLEVEDVAKAHQIAMTAVEEVKGRITKSELKQHSAGQLQSILHADIPPAKKDTFRDKLKKLGILSDHQENQQQHTEAGVGKGPELKTRLDDERFEVTMHNRQRSATPDRRLEGRHQRRAGRVCEADRGDRQAQGAGARRQAERAGQTQHHGVPRFQRADIGKAGARQNAARHRPGAGASTFSLRSTSCPPSASLATRFSCATSRASRRASRSSRSLP